MVEPGIPLPEGKIYNSNMTMLSARLRELGIESFHMEAVKDDPTVMSEKLKEAAEATGIEIKSSQDCINYIIDSLNGETAKSDLEKLAKLELNRN